MTSTWSGARWRRCSRGQRRAGRTVGRLGSPGGPRRASRGPGAGGGHLAGGLSPLTGRERDVLVAARDGARVSDIAGRLFLSEGTVRNYLSSAIAKTAALLSRLVSG